MTARNQLEMWFIDLFPELQDFVDWLTDDILVWEIFGEEEIDVEQVGL